MSDPVKLDYFHTTLWRDIQSGDEHRYRLAFTAALNHFCDTECEQCATVFCPHHSPQHFQADCPACHEGDDPHPPPIPHPPL